MYSTYCKSLLAYPMLAHSTACLLACVSLSCHAFTVLPFVLWQALLLYLDAVLFAPTWPHKELTQVLQKVATSFSGSVLTVLLMYIHSTAIRACWSCLGDFFNLKYLFSQSTVDTIWSLYADHKPSFLPRVFVNSWIKHYDPGGWVSHAVLNTDTPGGAWTLSVALIRTGQLGWTGLLCEC